MQSTYQKCTHVVYQAEEMYRENFNWKIELVV